MVCFNRFQILPIISFRSDHVIARPPAAAPGGGDRGGGGGDSEFSHPCHS